MNTQTELLPCPFCAGAPEYENTDERVRLRCTGCGSESGLFFFSQAECDSGDGSEAEARAAVAWNRRASLAQGDAGDVEFDDPRVQAVYQVLCDEAAPPTGEHWEGFAARRIVGVLAQGNAAVPAVTDFDEWQRNPYTKVLQDSIANDYEPKHAPAAHEAETVEFTELKRVTDAWHAAIGLANSRQEVIVQLRAKLEAQGDAQAERKNAERYRWLRENFIRVTLLPEQTFWQFVGSLAGDNWRGGLDAAIDAAIVASKGEPK